MTGAADIPRSGMRDSSTQCPRALETGLAMQFDRQAFGPFWEAFWGGLQRLAPPPRSIWVTSLGTSMTPSGRRRNQRPYQRVGHSDKGPRFGSI